MAAERRVAVLKSILLWGEKKGSGRRREKGILDYFPIPKFLIIPNDSQNGNKKKERSNFERSNKGQRIEDKFKLFLFVIALKFALFLKRKRQMLSKHI